MNISYTIYHPPSTIDMANAIGKSHLLNCPPEIRSIIYGYVLTYDNPIVFSYSYSPKVKPDPTMLSLMQVSKSVEREAAPIFYKQNVFRFHCWLSTCDLDIPDGDSWKECPFINVPERYNKFLRHVKLDKEQKQGKQGGPSVLDLHSAIDYLAKKYNILSLSIDLHRMDVTIDPEWDLDPLSMLRNFDGEKCIFTTVGKLVNLSHLEIRKTQSVWQIPERWPSEWTAELLNQVKVENFARAKAVLYRRQAGDIQNEYSWSHLITEEFLMDLEQTGV